jgi:NTP pyrophosphatase (non-canonical NTP hydrolase)
MNRRLIDMQRMGKKGRVKMNFDKTIRQEMFLNEVMREVERAETLFPIWPKDPLHALGIVQEEVGETFKAVLEVIYEADKKDTSLNDVGVEMIQMAAMTLRFIFNWGEYEFKKSKKKMNNTEKPKKNG